MTTPDRDWLRVAEVAAQLQVSPHTVRRWAREEGLCHQVLSKRNIRIPARALEAFLASRTQGGISPEPRSSLSPASRISTPISLDPMAPSSGSASTPPTTNELEKGLLSTPGLLPPVWSLRRDGDPAAKGGRS
jgi:excisionase family DNA binding protein